MPSSPCTASAMVSTSPINLNSAQAPPAGSAASRFIVPETDAVPAAPSSSPLVSRFAFANGTGGVALPLPTQTLPSETSSPTAVASLLWSRCRILQRYSCARFGRRTWGRSYRGPFLTLPRYSRRGCSCLLRQRSLEPLPKISALRSGP